jgi:HEAT repeat protein
MRVDDSSSRPSSCAARWVSALLLAGVASGSACTAPPRRADFDSIDPSERSAAAAKAAEEKDRAAVPDLIIMLDSSDPASRMVAIAALERITGERLGYSATDDRAERNAAVRRWVQYANDNGYVPADGEG